MDTLATFSGIFGSAHEINRLMALLILGGFIVFSLLLWNFNFALKRSLKSGISYLSGKPRNSGGVPDIKQKIEDYLIKDPILRHAWQEYSETLVVEGPAGDQQFRSTREADDFFSYETIVHSVSLMGIRQGVFETIPALLTGLGLLGTFLGLMIGFPPEIKSLDQIADSIPLFMTGMRGAFLSSVFGVGLGLAFNLIEKFSSDRRHTQCQRLSELLDGLFIRRPEHYFLAEISRVSEGQLGELKMLAVQIGNEVVRGITGTAASNLKIDEHVKDGIAKGFNVLATSLTEFTEFQKQYFESLKEAQSLQSNILQSYKDLHAVSKDASEAVKQTSQSVKGVSDQLQMTSEAFKTVSGEVRQLVAQQQTTSATITQLSNNLSQTSRELIERQGAFLKSLQESLASFSTSNSNLNSQIAEYHGRLKTHTEDNFKAIDSHLAGGIDRFKGALGTLSGFVESLNHSVENIKTLLPIDQNGKE